MTTQDTIAHYRITAKLGAGGMGEVYRARDTRLRRDVAIKVIPENFVQDPVRMSRFKREAQVLASLNHPNIAVIYGVEDRAIVMELVAGVTLGERISSGPIPLEEALPIAKQIADALEYAHEHGIIHRDLKPSNIKITPEGRVKVLDFGLAKALSSDTAPAFDPDVSPTITLKDTTDGIIIGTVGYMSPEQARGKAVDKRADIWAFGVVLLEMLTGRSVFTGETVSDTLAAVLRSEIDYSHLPPDTPPGVRTLIERCLERDPARRLRDIGDAVILMDSAPTPVFAATHPQPRKHWLPWATGFAGAALAACLVWFLWPVYSPEPIRFEIDSPPGAIAAGPAVSPDGRSIAFEEELANGSNSLYVRQLGRLETIPVPGSETGFGRPFWSPDGRRLGLFAGGKLSTVRIGGGDVQTLIDGIGNSGYSGYSGIWSSTGVILFAEIGKPIYRIPEGGGTATPVLALDASRGETAQLLNCFLPDGKHFLYTSLSQEGADIYEGSLDGSKPIRVLNSAAVLGFARPAHASTGYLLFYSNHQILLRPFDPGSARVSGNAILVQSGYYTPTNLSPKVSAAIAAGGASISRGTLVYAGDYLRQASSQITWLSREGRMLQTVGDPSVLSDLSMSLDQRYLLFATAESSPGVWVSDLRRGGATRLTSNEDSASTPVFSPNGDRIAYTSEQNGESAILIQSSHAIGAPQTLFKTRMEVHPASWSRDGRWLACIIGEPPEFHIDLIPVSSGRKPIAVVSTQFEAAYQPQFSPDGRWIAYTSHESGRYEIYVVTVPKAAGGSAAVQGRWQVSTTDGQQPRWRADGKELFYISQQGEMMSVDIDSNANRFQASTPQALFPTGLLPRGPTFSYDVSADGRRFVLLKPVKGVAPPLKVIVNWASAFGVR